MCLLYVDVSVAIGFGIYFVKRRKPPPKTSRIKSRKPLHFGEYFTQRLGDCFFCNHHIKITRRTSNFTVQYVRTSLQLSMMCQGQGQGAFLAYTMNMNHCLLSFLSAIFALCFCVVLRQAVLLTITSILRYLYRLVVAIRTCLTCATSKDCSLQLLYLDISIRMLVLLNMFLMLSTIIYPGKSLMVGSLKVHSSFRYPLESALSPGALHMSGSRAEDASIGIASNGTASAISATRAKGFKNLTSMRSKNLLIIGLGNPGPEYDATRHNVGFRVLDEFAASKKVSMKFTSKFNADYGAIRIGDKNVGLLKPGTFINNSGGPIKKIMENFKLAPKDILIVADDIALDCGALRLREKGSHGGHNGHRDIEAVLKTRNYSRLRVGVSGPGRKSLPDHVLGEFNENEKDLVSVAVTKSCRTIEDWILEDDYQVVINSCNSRPPQSLQSP